VARDDQFQLGGVKHVQQWTEHQPLQRSTPYSARCIGDRRPQYETSYVRSVRNERIHSSAVFVRSNATSSPCSRISWSTKSHAAERSSKPSSVTSRPAHQLTSARQTSRAAWLFGSSASFCTLTGDEASGRSQTRTC